VALSPAFVRSLPAGVGRPPEGFHGGDEARADAVRAHGGGLHRPPGVAEASEVCCRYHVRFTEQRVCGFRVNSESAHCLDRGHGQRASQ
jgi:hypothetical protein